MANKNVEDFYPIEIRFHDGSYIAEIPTLALIHKSDTPNGALDEVRRVFDDTVNKYKALDALMPHEKDGWSGRNSGAQGPIEIKSVGGNGSFFRSLFVLAIFAVLLIVPVLYGVQLLNNYVSSASNRVATAISQVDSRTLSNIVIKAADTAEQLTPEREQQLIDAIERLVVKIKPFREAIDPLLQPNPVLIEAEQSQPIPIEQERHWSERP